MGNCNVVTTNRNGTSFLESSLTKTIPVLKLINPEVHLEVYYKEIIRDLDKDLYQLPFIPAMH